MPGSQRTYGPGVCTGRNQWVLCPGATGQWVLASPTVSRHPPPLTPPRERKLPLCSPRRGQARLTRH